MKSKITKFAAAAAIFILTGLLISFLGTSKPVYALAQTIEASRGLKQLYFEFFVPSDPEPVKECWVEFDESGQPKNVRTNLHKYWGDRKVVHIWKEGKTETWREEPNLLLYYESESFTAKILHLVGEYDPRRAVESLYERERKGEVEMEVEEPANRSEPIIVRGTFAPGKYLLEKPNLPSFCDVLYVDRDTKLVTAIEVYELRNGEYEYNGVWKYNSYDEPFVDGIFDLEDEVPQDVKRVDLMAGDIGLEQQQLTDEEVAVKVVRGFFEALIEKNYAGAGKFVCGSLDPDERIEEQERLEQFNVLRIVSIGKPTTAVNDRLSPGSLRVPYRIEYEKDGRRAKNGYLPVKKMFWDGNWWAIPSKFHLE
ncbi:MAG: hypothetical protein ACYS9T_12155 [Planctomycetota bacterium]|jgi:hypothetical protein